MTTNTTPATATTPDLAEAAEATAKAPAKAPAKKAPSKRRPPPAAANWKSKGSAAELGETEQIAHAIVTDRPDLMPSVDRIMSSSLDTEARQRAIELFRTALDTPGDKHRDPRVAIEQCTPKAS
jgi:hypothetical protein